MQSLEEAESSLGFPLPADLRESLRCHDGETSLLGALPIGDHRGPRDTDGTLGTGRPRSGGNAVVGHELGPCLRS
ncbi:hypothetical protein [Streptomyces sp. NPDC090798]|uniref:hypothetical protein n=1 Tax=Streptomyces sp. NPDC090798 TaxID=3365968 RepID=UPI00380676E9